MGLRFRVCGLRARSLVGMRSFARSSFEMVVRCTGNAPKSMSGSLRHARFHSPPEASMGFRAVGVKGFRAQSATVYGFRG